MKKTIFIFIQLFLCITFWSIPAKSIKINNLQFLTKANNQFAIELYHQLKDKNKNILFSPFSIYTTFGIFYIASDKQTKEIMSKVLHFPLKGISLHKSFSKILYYFNNISKKEPIKLNIINCLWIQKGYNIFEKSDINLIKKYYQSDFYFVDFVENYKNVRKKINNWIQNNTNKKIKSIINPEIITPLTVLILCNIIYFKGEWYLKFDPQFTVKDDFYVSLKKIKKVYMMKKISYFKFKDFGEFKAIELPYEGRTLSMIIFLPNRITGLSDLEDKLTITNVRKWINELTNSNEEKVFLCLPRFKILFEVGLSKALAQMGLAHLFKDVGGLSKNKRDNMFIGEILHKTFINVNESGTEVIATSIPIYFGSSIEEPVLFKANHPFLFLIRENKTKTILFLGRVRDPLTK